MCVRISIIFFGLVCKFRWTLKDKIAVPLL